MKTRLFILSTLLSSFCFSQKTDDSTIIKNQLMIENLKNRISVIDNNTNEFSGIQKQLDELRKEVVRQNDSINKLLNIINELKRFAASTKEEQNKKPSSLVLNSKNEKLAAKNYNDNDFNALKKADPVLQQYLSSCNCSPLFYKPYQVELDFKTITDLNAIIKNYESLNSNNKIVIVGHADKSGIEEKNIALSKQRAEKLKNYLIIASDKIKKENILIEWYGSSKPIENLTEDKKEFNRRTEVIVN